MPPIILTLLQALFLLLLYVFVARAVRAVLRDVRTAAPASAPRQARAARPSPAASAGSPMAPSQRRGGRGDRPRAQPRELVVHVSGGRPQVLPLDDGDITFGRTASATVVLDDPYVSDRHARVHHDGRGWVVSDLGSTNGTFLNRVKVTAPTPIAPGDQLGVGRTVVEVRR